MTNIKMEKNKMIRNSFWHSYYQIKLQEELLAETLSHKNKSSDEASNVTVLFPQEDTVANENDNLLITSSK